MRCRRYFFCIFGRRIHRNFFPNILFRFYFFFCRRSCRRSRSRFGRGRRVDDLQLFCGRFRIHAFHGKTFHRALFYTGTALHAGIGIDNPLSVLPVNPYRSRRTCPFTGAAENTLFPLIDNVSAVDRKRRPRLQGIGGCHRRFEKIGNYPFHKGHIAHNALLSFTTTDTGING